MKVIEQTSEIIYLEDQNTGETIALGSQVVVFEDNNGAMHRESTSRALLSDGCLISTAEQVGPKCGIRKCQTRLSSTFRKCARCETPLCFAHFKLLGGRHYCAWCRRIEVVKRVSCWLWALIRIRRERS